jgi:leucyl-tRNA synthetase
VNGRLRGQVALPRGAAEADVLRAAERSEPIAKWIAGKERVKVIFVPDRLVNVVVREGGR